jgi:hypothetical protein
VYQQICAASVFDRAPQSRDFVPWRFSDAVGPRCVVGVPVAASEKPAQLLGIARLLRTRKVVRWSS